MTLIDSKFQGVYAKLIKLVTVENESIYFFVNSELLKSFDNLSQLHLYLSLENNPPAYEDSWSNTYLILPDMSVNGTEFKAIAFICNQNEILAYTELLGAIDCPVSHQAIALNYSDNTYTQASVESLLTVDQVSLESLTDKFTSDEFKTYKLHCIRGEYNYCPEVFERLASQD